MSIITGGRRDSDTARVACDCSTDHPGILWPWGSDGEHPPALPYVERCDTCTRYVDDQSAAQALASALQQVGWTARVGVHHCTTADDRLERVGVFVVAVPRALEAVEGVRTPEPALLGAGDVLSRSWRVLLDAAKRSLRETL